MGATLKASFDQAYKRDGLMGTGVRITEFIDDLRKKFGAGSQTLHRHDGTMGDGGKVLFSNLATAPTGLTGGTTHNKTAHRKVSDRTVALPVMDWRLPGGTALTFASSVTLPYYSIGTTVFKVVWPGGITKKIQQSILVPDNYDESADTQALKARVRSLAASTTVVLDSEARVITNGALTGTDLNPATAALSTNQANPEEVSMVIAYATLAQEDGLSVRVGPASGGAGADVEMWQAWFEYTGEE